MKALFLTLLYTTVIATSAELTTIRGAACITSNDPNILAYPAGTFAYEYEIDEVVRINETISLDLALSVYVCTRGFGWILIPAPRSLFANMQRAYTKDDKEWIARGYWAPHTLERQQQKNVYDIRHSVALKKFLNRKEYAEWNSGKVLTTYTMLDLGSQGGLYQMQGYQILKLTFNQNQILSATID